MTISQTISSLGSVPDIADPSTFEARMNALLTAALPTFRTEANALAAQFNTEIQNINALLATPAQYTFDSATADADPTAGKLRLGSATQNTSTVVRVDLTDAGGGDQTAALAAWASSTSAYKGTLRIAHRDTPTTKWLLFSVSAVASPTGYKNVTVAPLGSSAASPFTNGDLLTVTFVRNGDAGNAQDITNQAPNSGTTAGTSTAYTLSPATAISAYAANQTFFVTFHTACGAAPTLQISSIATPPNLVRALPDGTFRNLTTGEITTNWRSRVTLLSATQALVEELPFAASTIIDRAYVEYTTNASITGVIPFDDTIPQNTEGTQILSVSLTPKSTTNRVRLRFQGQFTSATVPLQVMAALFSSASANALDAKYGSVTTADLAGNVVLEFEYVPGTASALTFSVRMGTNGGTAFRLNGQSGSRVLGGVSRATLIVEEIAA